MSIVDWIYPKKCVGCGRGGEYICESCTSKLVRPPSICPRCCRPSVEGWVHQRCRTAWGMDRLVVGLPYRGVVQQCLKRVKYGSQWDRVKSLFLLWQKQYSDTVTQCHGEWVVTSVPMWKEKERERGFNQAEVFGRLVAQEWGLRYLKVLERVRETRPMYGLNKKQRILNIKEAFEIKKQCHSDTVSQILLVDDVWTTGATMRECARVLKKAGAREVWGLTLAR